MGEAAGRVAWTTGAGIAVATAVSLARLPAQVRFNALTASRTWNRRHMAQAGRLLAGPRRRLMGAAWPALPGG